MRKIFQEKVITVLTDTENKEYIILSVGFATFFFGFALGALLNLYLLLTHSQLFVGLRTALTFKSTIFGDGIILPIITMIASSYLLRNLVFITRKVIRGAMFLGILATLYFHAMQGLLGLVNWSMPTPWHWNAIGALHAFYMLSVATFLSLFYLVALKVIRRERSVPKQVLIVSIGIIIFLILLRLDYTLVSVSSLIPFP